MLSLSHKNYFLQLFFIIFLLEVHKSMFLKFKNLSEDSLLVYVDEVINEVAHQRIQSLISVLLENPFDGIIEIVPGYTNLCLYYNPILISRFLQKSSNESISECLQKFLEKVFQYKNITLKHESRIVKIPVIYGGKYGPDLDNVAKLNGLSEEEVIAIHSSKDYLVYMLGFAPGFPFLGGLDSRIATPRHQTPRLEIAAGSVGIAGEQTGIYPLATPGGWQIIGRTMKALILPEQDPPTLLRAGDRIRFIPVKEHAND